MTDPLRVESIKIPIPELSWKALFSISSFELDKHTMQESTPSSWSAASKLSNNELESKKSEFAPEIEANVF